MVVGSLKLEGVFLDHSEHFQLGPVDAEFSGTVGLVGRNGSGKSTLFRLITGFADSHGGRITWGGERVYRENSAYKRRIGYLPQPLELPLWSSAGDLLEYTCRLRGLNDRLQRQARMDAVIEMWRVNEFVNKPLIACSYGMRKRVALCLALVHEPELIILDEPLSGLDVSHIMTFQKWLKYRDKAGLVSVFSTHIMSFVADEAAGVFVMRSGQVQQLVEWQQWDHPSRLAALTQHLESE